MIKNFQDRYRLYNKELAKLLGCSISSVQKWRSQEVAPSEILRKFLILLDATFDGNRTALLNWMETEAVHPDQTCPADEVSTRPPAPLEHPAQEYDNKYDPLIAPEMFSQNEMTLYTDSEGIILAVSPSAARWLGYDETVLTHHPLHTLFGPDAEECCEQIVRSAATGQSTLFFVPLTTTRNEPVHAALEASVQLRHGRTAIVWSMQDITGLCQCRQLLKKCLGQKSALTRIIHILRADAGEDLDARIIRVIATIGEEAGAARACVFQFAEEGTLIRATHSWQADADDIETRLPREVSAQAYAFWLNKFRNRKFIHIENIQDALGLPEPQREALCACNAKTLLAMPVFINSTLTGFVEWIQTGEIKPWVTSEIELARAALDLLGLALKHQKNTNAVSEQET